MFTSKLGLSNYLWIAELRSLSLGPGATNVVELLSKSVFCKMTRVKRIASNK